MRRSWFSLLTISTLAVLLAVLGLLQYRWLKLIAGGGAEGRFASSGGESEGRFASSGGGAEGRFASSGGESEGRFASSGGTIFAVGDDDQSIYAFRGAHAGNMQDFQRDFAVKHLIKLEQNYRSHGNILDAANTLIRNNRGRLGKELWTDAGAGEPIRVYAAPSDNAEAAFIVDEVKALRNDGWNLSDMALLYRSNAQSRVLEHQLFTAGVPYRVYGGLRFFDRQEIKHALAYLRLLANPDDDTAFARVVNFPTRGIGSRSIEALQEAAPRWKR